MQFNNLDEDECAWIGHILRDMGVLSFTAILTGGGDSGSIDDIMFKRQDGIGLNGEIESVLQNITIETNYGSVTAYDVLCEKIEREANAKGNWYDGNGASVESAYDIVNGKITVDFISFSEFDDEEEDDDYDPDEDIEDEYVDQPHP